TTIKYQIPSNVKGETANVKLIVYDILGREVATLVNKQQKAGYYEVQFTSNNVSARGGQVLTSGVYFYRILAGDFVDTKKTILLR
ncbi:MAG: T9SS type A sorting domain-containing protein, partial [Melioribacteraceae bacterium]|nr:T9SS type A sorting domain-containing protein [Melioribacteraceae bacterium]